jgi:hypothetical protein
MIISVFQDKPTMQQCNNATRQQPWLVHFIVQIVYFAVLMRVWSRYQIADEIHINSNESECWRWRLLFTFSSFSLTNTTQRNWYLMHRRSICRITHGDLRWGHSKITRGFLHCDLLLHHSMFPHGCGEIDSNERVNEIIQLPFALCIWSNHVRCLICWNWNRKEHLLRRFVIFETHVWNPCGQLALPWSSTSDIILRECRIDPCFQSSDSQDLSLDNFLSFSLTNQWLECRHFQMIDDWWLMI